LANRTQCPKCLTIYVITDQQYRKSKGKVRCGNCRVTFNAAFLAENNDTSDTDSQLDEQNSQENTVGTSAENSSANTASTSRDIKEHQRNIEKSTTNRQTESPANSVSRDSIESPAIESKKDDGFSSSNSHMSLSENLNPDLSLDLDEEFDSDALPETSENLDDLALDIQTGHNKSKRDQKQQISTKSSIENKTSAASHPPVTAPAPPVTTPSPKITTSNVNSDEQSKKNAAGGNEDQELISEVKNLIDEKLIITGSLANPSALEAKQEATTPATSKGEDSDIFVLDPKPRFHRVKQWLLNPLLLFLVLGLSIALLYQLWLRQAVPILEDERLPRLIGPVIQPLEKSLSEKYLVKLPVRRDLSGLELLSARTEAHPTRYSTTLLKASLINRADIAQPFPWLELSLSDENGRIIARRALSPDNYLHNNRLENRIKANELRQVTIELLSFPRQAHGFELRILNN